jgi:hypothetical protein
LADGLTVFVIGKYASSNNGRLFRAGSSDTWASIHLNGVNMTNEGRYDGAAANAIDEGVGALTAWTLFQAAVYPLTGSTHRCALRVGARPAVSADGSGSTSGVVTTGCAWNIMENLGAYLEGYIAGAYALPGGNYIDDAAMLDLIAYYYHGIDMPI